MGTSLQHFFDADRYAGERVDIERDAQLVSACQAGDSSCFDELYSRYFQRLARFCYRRVGSPDDATELAQEAFARAWKSLPNFGGDRHFYPWISVIAGHLCTDMLRRRARVFPVEGEELERVGSSEVPSADPDECVIESQDGDAALVALGRICVRHREVLILREISEWSYRDIAHHYGVPVTTVETLLWRARRALQREFRAAARRDRGTAA